MTIRLQTFVMVLCLGLTSQAQASAARSWGDSATIVARRATMVAHIDHGVRAGCLSPQQALRLRAEFNDIDRRAHAYGANGVSHRERVDLDRRFDRLSERIRIECRDNDRFGRNRLP